MRGTVRLESADRPSRRDFGDIVVGGAVGVKVSVGIGVSSCAAVGVAVGDAVGVGVEVALGSGVGVMVGVAVGVAVGVGTGVGVGSGMTMARLMTGWPSYVVNGPYEADEPLAYAVIVMLMPIGSMKK